MRHQLKLDDSARKGFTAFYALKWGEKWIDRGKESSDKRCSEEELRIQGLVGG